MSDDQRTAGATALLWFRRDLRLGDLPALAAAHRRTGGSGGPGSVVPVFVLDPRLWDGAGLPRRRALVGALGALREATAGALVVRSGDPLEVIPRLVAETGAASVHVSAETTPYGRHRDRAVAAALPEGVDLVASGSPYAVTPGKVTKADGDPYRVFTPFSRAWLSHGWPDPSPVPAGVRWGGDLRSDRLPEAAAERGRPAVPEVSEAAALDRWQRFMERGLDRYDARRDRPDVDGTSLLSAQLHFGTLHPRTLLRDLAEHPDGASVGAKRFRTELCWREFYADVLWHHPGSAWQDFNPRMAVLDYDDPTGPGGDHAAVGGAVAGALAAWCEGRTGYPLVDAGMRQLVASGWMHNRVRMVTASFLAKDLHLWWGHGARYFLQHLVDGDVASNNHGWQWVAGTGTDAAPYFRVFNPVEQGRKFDPDGDYVRRWVPELAHLPGAAAHQPWRHPEGYGHGYPERIVDHAAERVEALERYNTSRGATRPPG